MDWHELPIPALAPRKACCAFVPLRSTCVSGSEARLGKLQELGVDVGICARGEDFSARALEATNGKGVDLAVNLVGGTVFGADQRSLGNFGGLAVVGYVDGVMKTEINLEATHGKSLEIFGISNVAS